MKNRLTGSIDWLPQYGQCFEKAPVDIPISWNFILQVLHEIVVAFIDIIFVVNQFAIAWNYSIILYEGAKIIFYRVLY
jgi:hypothetical protein